MTAIVLLAAAVVLTLASSELILRWFDVADPPVFRLDARFGYMMCPDQSASTRGHRFRINNAGLRGADISVRKIGERRAVFVGDSITYGGGSAPDADLFVTRVAEALSGLRHERVAAVNVSAPGWGIQNMAAFVDAHGVFEADVIVWIVPSADFRRWKTGIQDFGYPQKRPHSRLIYAVTSWLSAVRDRVGRAQAVPEQSADPGSEVLEANLVALDTMLRRLGAVGIPMVIATQPYRGGYGNLADDVRRFQALAHANGAAFVDLEPAFRMSQDMGLFLDGVHLNGRGHEVVANAILSTVAAAMASRD